MDSAGHEPGRDPLRILHVSEVHWGGVVTLLKHFVAEQAGHGHDVHVLAPSGMPTLPSCTRHEWRVDRGHPWTAGAALLDLRRTVRSLRPDVVHLHSFVAGLLGRLPPRRLWLGAPVPVVYQPHAWSLDLFTRRPVRAAVRRWEAWAAVNADVLVTNCDDEIEEGRSIGVDVPAHALGVAVDLTRFHDVSDADRRRHRRELGITAPNALVCVGRLARQKGQDLLLQTWEHSRPPDTQLILVGPGDADALRSHAPTQWGTSVLAVGEQADVRPWVWASDALVLPSRYETVALVVAEAMACGCPVVATAVNGATATVTDGPWPPAGAVVPLGDMEALIAESSRRLADRELCESERVAGRKRAESLFSPHLVAQRLELAYRDAVSRRMQGAEQQ
jgi:glycosyltransferase involved in cell wall biosynthesis